jgi:hypothetical protein
MLIMLDGMRGLSIGLVFLAISLIWARLANGIKMSWGILGLVVAVLIIIASGLLLIADTVSSAV